MSDALALAVAPVVEAKVKSFTEGRKSWYAVTAKSDDEAEVSIYDTIGLWGITAREFVNDIGGLKARVLNVRLNTPGGEVTEGTAIYNALKNHPARVIMHIDGIAASAGSFVAMSGDEIRMADNAYLMIHNARGGVMGEASDMRKYADVLEKMNANIAGMYQKKAGKTVEHWRGLMDAETWFTAEEAKAEGLIDQISTSAATASAQIDTKFYNSIYKNIPDAVRQRWGLPTNTTTEVFAEPQRSDPALTPTERITAMPDTSNASTAQPAAVNPGSSTGDSAQAQIEKFNAVAAENYIAKGRQQGFAEGKKFAEDRMRQIQAAAPGRPDIAINAFLAGQDASTVALINNAAAQAEAKAHEKISAMEVENARLQAQMAAGGHPGVSNVASPMVSVPSNLDPESQAELEWDGNPVLRAQNGNNKKAWMLYRTNALKGNVRVLSH